MIKNYENLLKFNILGGGNPLCDDTNFEGGATPRRVHIKLSKFSDNLQF